MICNIPSGANFLGCTGYRLKPEAGLGARPKVSPGGKLNLGLEPRSLDPSPELRPLDSPPLRGTPVPTSLDSSLLSINLSPLHATHLWFLLPFRLWSHLEHFVELVSVCFPVRTHGVYQRHLRSPDGWKSLRGISRTAGLEGGWQLCGRGPGVRAS